MKKIIIISIFLIAAVISKVSAQPPGGTLEVAPVSCDEYIQRPGNDKFVGTWIGTLNGKTLQLELKNVKANYSLLLPNATLQHEICEDIVYGFHKFIDNNVEIENNLGASSFTIYQKKNSILAGVDDNNTNILTGTLVNKSKNKSLRFRISYIDSLHIKIESLENVPGVRINEPGKPAYDSSIDIPNGLILTKQ